MIGGRVASRSTSVFLLLPASIAFAVAAAGPPKGVVLAAGGGNLGPEVLNRFIHLAGGPEAPIVFIPTALEPLPPNLVEVNILRKAGVKNLTILHTTDRKVADSKQFVEPLRKARGVWFGGGRQWRLVDSYLNTRTLRELRAVLDRGGVIGGSSAGATILGSYLVRGARSGNQIMMAPGYEQGFGFLRGVAIDQHLLTRKREKDLLGVVRAHPALLGIGLDEGTAVIVQGDRFEVVGRSKVAIYETGKPYYFLSAGDRFNLKTRTRVE
jgi:cyanophycinase